MADSKEKPLINLSEISERDALTYSIGHYFEMFSSVEQHLASALSELLEIDLARIQFLWKDSFTDHKIKTVRRAAIAVLGPENPDWLALKPVLNELAKDSIEFRNELAHGLILEEGDQTKYGKPGHSPFLQYQEFQKIDSPLLKVETERLSRIGLALIAFCAAI